MIVQDSLFRENVALVSTIASSCSNLFFLSSFLGCVSLVSLCQRGSTPSPREGRTSSPLKRGKTRSSRGRRATASLPFGQRVFPLFWDYVVFLLSAKCRACPLRRASRQNTTGMFADRNTVNPEKDLEQLHTRGLFNKQAFTCVIVIW